MRLGDSNQALTANLNRLLEGQELSRIELARRMRVADGTLGRIRYGTANPTIDVLERIARYFRVKPWELLRPVDTSPEDDATHLSEWVAGLWEEIDSLNEQQQRALLGALRALRSNET